MWYVIGAFVVGGLLGILVMAIFAVGSLADSKGYDRERG